MGLQGARRGRVVCGTSIDRAKNLASGVATCLPNWQAVVAQQPGEMQRPKPTLMMVRTGNLSFVIRAYIRSFVPHSVALGSGFINFKPPSPTCSPFSCRSLREKVKGMYIPFTFYPRLLCENEE